ncbi:MAG: methylenetetrahydrofolate reductase [NAD(P)H] [Candidatus Omnitrophota bacterium]|nr:methylenetetrahydrofolate reductase [NAD(P)H] [Candidatus Omnitrophota bacterium]
MKIIDILITHPKGVAFEFFPPRTDAGRNALVTTVRALEGYNPLYTSMTYGALGSTQERTREATYMLLEHKSITVMPHLTCIGATAASIGSLLDEYKAKGLENIMALRGDVPQGVTDFDFSKQEFPYARQLVSFIRAYNHFCIGVAVYPEGHLEDVSFDVHLEYMKRKIDAGASFAVTQMFFDNSYFYAFIERLRKEGITIPILPGILPLTDIQKARQFCSTCKVSIPDVLAARLDAYREKPPEMLAAGIEATIAQCRDLIAHGYQQLHFFTLNKPEVMKAILSAI